MKYMVRLFRCFFILGFWQLKFQPLTGFLILCLKWANLQPKYCSYVGLKYKNPEPEANHKNTNKAYKREVKEIVYNRLTG